jgi:hypothetical protein
MRRPMTLDEIRAELALYSFCWNGQPLSFWFDSEKEQLVVQVVATNARAMYTSQDGVVTVTQRLNVNRDRLTRRNIRSLIQAQARKLWVHEFHEHLRVDGRLVKDDHRPGRNRRRRE